MGLDAFGFRDYDPACGCWTAKDPIGFAAGDSNLYRYVNVNPINFVDRTGESPLLIPAGVTAVLTLFNSQAASGEPTNSPKTCDIPLTKLSANYDSESYDSVINRILNDDTFDDDEKSSLINFINSVENGKYENYDTISKRHEAYKLANTLLNQDGSTIKSEWFEAAAIVTAWNAIGGAEIWDLSIFTSEYTDDFLKAGNEFLFPHNMNNLSHLLKGEDIPGMEGLRGKALDYALVEFEQKKVTEFIKSYSPPNNISFNKIADQINGSFNDFIPRLFSSKQVKNVIKEKFHEKNRQFNFLDESHRIELGKGLVDNLYSSD